MRINRWYVLLSAVVLALANLAVPFGLAAQDYSAAVYLLVSCVLAVLTFFLANSENRWRFPWWTMLGLGTIVVVLAIWLEVLDKAAANFAGVATHGVLPRIYFFLTLQALLLVKLTGPKTPLDFWLEQGVGFVFVLFGCLVCKDAGFSALLLLYIGTAVAALTLYHFRRRQEAEAVCRVHVTVRPVRAPTPELGSQPRVRGLLGWGLLVVPLVVLLFLFVPRPDLIWGDGVGVAPFGDGMDLNRTGRVKLGTHTAFTVVVTDDKHRPVANLSVIQRWRGAVFADYRSGRWYPPQKAWATAETTGPRNDNLAAKPGERQFAFTVSVKLAGGLLLAEPVVPLPGRIQLRTAPWAGYPSFYPNTATLEPPLGSAKEVQPCNYTQVATVGTDPDRAPAFGIDPNVFRKEALLIPPGIRTYTTTTLHDLAGQELYGLNECDLEGEGDRARDLTPRASVRGERVAVALTQYLNSSRDFAYSLDRARFDKKLDPTEDFLVNVHQGHCERFASGLALMLRAEGVPARVVVGFRGCEPKGGGNFLVRQDTAHAWVEALVPPKGTAALGSAVGCPGCDYWLKNQAQPEWLTLDPTSPYPPPRPASTGGGWFSAFLTWISTWWGGLGTSNWSFNPVNFDGHTQADFLSWAAANLPYLLVVVLVLLVLVYLVRSLLQRFGLTAPATPVAEPFYQRLLQLLAWHRGLEPQPAQTPREFGAAAAEVLASEPAAHAVAGVPAWVVELYYRVRFGGRPLAAEEQRAVDGRLEELKAGLK